MKKHIWLVRYLVRDENGDVAGYRTAFEAADVVMAALQAGDFFRVTYGPDYETIITSIGLADKDAEELVGSIHVDPLAIDWPE